MMKNLKEILYTGILLAAIISITACSQGKKSEQAESDEHEHSEMTEESDNHHDEGEKPSHDEEGEDHHHGGHDETAVQPGGDKSWTPGGNGAELIQSDFHFLAGSLENISPVVKEVDGSPVLELEADGTPAAFVFHNQYGNVGMIITLKKLDFSGTIRLLHHAKDLANYEFVSVSGNNMKLGRVVNGTEKVFDESDFNASSGWMALKVTAAGTHYKGYIGDKTITHGHGDIMEKGFVGIMLDGSGKVQIKSIELAPFEDE